MEPNEESDEEFFRELMEEEEAFFAMGDVVLNACYIEYALEDWPLLTQLSEEEKERVYDDFAAALQVAQSPAQVIGARGANLYLVIHQSVDLSIDDIEHILDSVCGHIAKQYPNQDGPQEFDAVSLSRRDIPEAVVRIGGKLYQNDAAGSEEVSQA